ncbi:MAG: hypothetical protein AAGE65_02545 [Planctomycetota bacterium]
MPFDSGRVTFCRFAVTGDGPASVDDAVLSILTEHRFRETEIGAPEEIEAGFVTPEHLLDTRFTYEKVGFGSAAGGASRLLVGVRIDTHKVPAEVKRAYRVMNEQAAAGENPSGFATKGQKQEARELADRQVREDLAKGMYRKSKVVPVLWDFATRHVYCGASGTTVIEQVVRLFRQSFAVDLSLLSAGVAAGELLRSQGRTRDYEDVIPSAFTKPPADTGSQTNSESDDPSPSAGPELPWIAKSIDLKDFLGNELLLWLWWQTETREGAIAIPGGEAYLAIDRSLDLDCAWGLGGKVSVRGDGPTRLRESAEALRTGKWPRKAGLLLSDGSQPWELTLQGDQWTVGAAKLPEVPDAQSPRELTDARLELTVTLGRLLDGLFTAFLEKRMSASWPSQRDAIRDWIRTRQRGGSGANQAAIEVQPVINATTPPRPARTAAEV